MSGISPPEIVIITLNELLFKLIFQTRLFSQQKFYGRISPLTDQLFSRGKFFGVSPLRPPDRTTLKTFPERILLRRLCCQSTEL